MNTIQQITCSALLALVAGCNNSGTQPTPLTPPGTPAAPPGGSAPAPGVPDSGAPGTTPPVTGAPGTTPPGAGAPGGGTVPPPGGTVPPGAGGVPPLSPVIDPFPEPNGVQSGRVDTLAFYDADATGQARAVRNDMQGSFTAMVQFAQSHVLNPSGNEARNMPRLTTERDALLLVTPDKVLGNVDSLQLTVTVDGVAKPVLTMRPPHALFQADRPTTDERPDVVYSHKAWSAVLPWDWVKPGMQIEVRDNKGRTGSLGGTAIDFAAPAELVIGNIQLGMLTAPPSSTGHYMLTNTAAAATDYFQTIPVSKLTVFSYEPMKLDRVMVSSGVIYDSASATSGDVYSGDMRGDTAKATFSTGINLANWGVTSSNMQSQNQPHITQTAVVHHARGVYTNGVVTHGLSGGNGILTLIDSVGNEFSHEIGHHFGLGHYPGQVGTNCFNCAHHHDSGWGFIANRNHMRANLNWGNKTLGDGTNGVPNFANLYPFGYDAMAGGSVSSSLSRYTHYTGYSTQQKIQPALNKAVFSAQSPTGYRKWNATTRAMENVAPAVPASNSEWYNSNGAPFRAPRRHGVPVFTILGGYDPVTGVGLLYPAARGNWGNVFDLPEPAINASARQCWLDVTLAGNRKKIALAPNRMGTNANKIHVQLAQDEQPEQVRLYCQEAGAQAKELGNITIPRGLPAMPPAVRVGREYGYAALRKAELPQFETVLLALSSKAVLTLSPNGSMLYDSYASFVNELTPAARTQLQRYQAQADAAARLNRWIVAYSAKLAANDQPAKDALVALIEKLGLGSKPMLPTGQFLKNGSNCLKTETVNNTLQVFVSGPAGCSAAANERWVQDAAGRIRSGERLDQCLTDMGGSNRVTFTTCSPRAENQVWDTSAMATVQRGSRCFDLASGYLTAGRGNLITYNCTGGANQKWSGITLSDNLLLPLTDTANLKYLPAN